MGIWAIRSSLKIHCYTCMSFKTCWSRLIYTKLSSHRSFVINMYVVTMAWRCISPWRNLEIDCDEIPVPFALLQGYWVVQNLHFLMVFAQGVQIANEATGFYMYYCRWQVAISALRFSVFTSVQSMFSSFFFLIVFTSESGNVLTYIKIIHLSSSLERPMETSRGNTASRHRDNVHVYDKWLVWG